METIDKIYIYGLSSSAEPEIIRYIGYTNNPYKRRCDHVTESRALKTHRHKWVRSVIESGNKLLISILRETTEEKKGNAEIETILLYKACGANLVNGNNGGIGGKCPTLETRKKLSLCKMGNTWNKGRMPSPQNLIALRASNKKPKTEQAKLNMSIARTGKPNKKIRKFKDEDIIEMYKLFNSGRAFDEIVEIMKLKRSDLSNILYTKTSYLDVKEKYKLKIDRPKLHGNGIKNYKTKNNKYVNRTNSGF